MIGHAAGVVDMMVEMIVQLVLEQLSVGADSRQLVWDDISTGFVLTEILIVSPQYFNTFPS